MAAKLTDTERQAILDTLRETENVRETARRHNRGESTVSRIGRAAGIVASARAKTKSASAARSVDMAAKRAKLAADQLDDAARLRAQLFAPCVVVKPMVVSQGRDMGSVVEIVEVHLDQPTFADQQRIQTAAAIAADKSLMLERADADGGGEAASLLERLVGTLIAEVTE